MKNNISPARLTAYKILYDVIENKAFSNISVNRNLNTSLKNPADRALAVNIVYGSLKKRNRLEKIISTLSKNPQDKINPRVRVILIMSLYQLFYLKKVPDYAVINDAVSMAKFFVGISCTGYVNAILRSAQRGGSELLKQERDFTQLMYYEYGFEKWLTELLSKDMGNEGLLNYAKVCESNPPLNIRVNTLKITAEQLKERLLNEDIETAQTFVTGSLSVLSGKNIFASSAFKEGLFYAQDLSGIITGYIAGFEKSDNVIDMCAAPGGKSFNASVISEGASITACDISAPKLSMLWESSKQLGLKNIRTVHLDATKTDEGFNGKFDKIICDVPCSGLGVIRRKPEILFSVSEAHLKSLAATQRLILSNALNYLKPGGVLVYSTCTINKDENERLVSRVLRDAPAYKLSPIDIPFALTSEHSEMKEGFLNLSPVADGTDGFFAAKIIRSK